jgi:hypothetical protein
MINGSMTLDAFERERKWHPFDEPERENKRKQ